MPSRRSYTGQATARKCVSGDTGVKTDAPAKPSLFARVAVGDVSPVASVVQVLVAEVVLGVGGLA